MFNVLNNNFSGLNKSRAVVFDFIWLVSSNSIFKDLVKLRQVSQSTSCGQRRACPCDFVGRPCGCRQNLCVVCWFRPWEKKTGNLDFKHISCKRKMENHTFQMLLTPPLFNVHKFFRGTRAAESFIHWRGGVASNWYHIWFQILTQSPVFFSHGRIPYFDHNTRLLQVQPLGSYFQMFVFSWCNWWQLRFEALLRTKREFSYLYSMVL